MGQRDHRTPRSPDDGRGAFHDAAVSSRDDAGARDARGPGGNGRPAGRGMTVFRGRVDAMAVALAGRLLALRWRQVSGRRGPLTAASPLQRPHAYFAGLTARPWWDPAALPGVEQLEGHADMLREELHGLLGRGYLQPPSIETIDARKRD